MKKERKGTGYAPEKMKKGTSLYTNGEHRGINEANEEIILNGSIRMFLLNQS